MSPIFDLTCELIRRASVTPDDAGCQALIAARLARAGFTIEHLRYGAVDNLWATHGGDGPVLVFLGHTDVVPSGPPDAWTSPPFEPTVRDGNGFGDPPDHEDQTATVRGGTPRYSCDPPDREDQTAAIRGGTPRYSCNPPDREDQTATVRGGTPRYSCDHPDREDQKAAIPGRTLHLYGRGAADMKSGVAAMVVALEAFVRARPDHAGTLALLLTSDEEGRAVDGVRRVADEFRRRGQRIDWCVVGEPSSKQRLGDLIRVGRRGSLTGRLRVAGVQGHVAYPDLARNPIHEFAPALAELAATRWDEGNEAFPPTSFQVSNLSAGTGADNVIPGELRAVFNFRFGTASTAHSLRERVEAILRAHGVEFRIDWWLSGEPFLTRAGALRDATVAAIREHCGIEPELSTGGGTSDGRFIAPLGAEVVELGPVNASIHQVDENVALDELEQLPGLYRAIAERLLVAATPAGIAG